MTRIFFTLSLFSLALTAAALVLGLGVGDLYGEIEESTLRWATVHRLTGVAAALAVVLVNCIAVTYFIGTARWVKEVVETYALDRQLAQRAARLKRATFPWALAGMLTVVGIIALGAAADPGTGRPGTEDWASVHLIGALVGIAAIAYAYFVQWTRIHDNQQIIAEVMARVAEIRQQRGLPTGV